MIKKLLLIAFVALLLGCAEKTSTEKTLIDSMQSRDLPGLWLALSKDASDPTLADVEKEAKKDQFLKDFPDSLPSHAADVARIVTDPPPKFERLGEKTVDHKIIAGYVATYPSGVGYVHDEIKIVRKIKIIIESDAQTGEITLVKIDNVLEEDVEATNALKKQKSERLWAEFLENPAENGHKISDILEYYPNASTPIAEINAALTETEKKLAENNFDGLLQISDVGGYATKGRLESPARGFGTELKDYAKVANNVLIPLEVVFVFDLEYQSVWTTESCFIFCSQTVHSKWDMYQSDVERTLKADAKESRSLSHSFDNIYYFENYRVTREYNDGTFEYDSDSSKTLRATNLRIKSIKIARSGT